MSYAPRRLRADRAEGVEVKLRARAEQLKPTKPPGPPGTPLGICRACATLVYTTDRAASGRSLLHAKCAGSGG